MTGFWKTLLNVAEDEFPLVVELPSDGEVAVILVPLLVFSTINVPKDKPLVLSIAWIITWLDETMVPTTKSVLYEFDPAVIEAVPMTSPVDIEEIKNWPPSEVKRALAISASPASWLTFIVKSARLSQELLDKETLTVGEKSKQER